MAERDIRLAGLDRLSDKQEADLLAEAVSEMMAEILPDLAPRLWCVIEEEIARNKESVVHFNAVINSVLLCIGDWAAARTPPDSHDQLVAAAEGIMRRATDGTGDGPTADDIRRAAYIEGRDGLMRDAADRLRSS